jgi:hypothetical protein
VTRWRLGSGDMALPDVLIALTACERRGKNGLTRRDSCGLMNRLCIAWLALAETLGISPD